MPPKKKGGSKKKGKSGGGGDLLVLRPELLRLTRQLDQDRVDALARRHDGLKQEQTILRERIKSGERDTHEFVAYFQRELEARDEQIQVRAAELAHAEATLREAADTQQATLSTQLAEAEKVRDHTTSSLRAKLLSNSDGGCSGPHV